MSKNDEEIRRWALWFGREMRRVHELVASDEDPAHASRAMIELLCTHVVGYGLSPLVGLSPQELTEIFGAELKRGVDLLATVLRAAAGNPERPS